MPAPSKLWWSQVLLVSAQDALLSRLMLRSEPKPSIEAQQTFCRKYFGSNRAASKKTRSAAELATAAEVLDSNM